MKPPERTPTIVPIQVLRAVAALAVVVSHTQFDLGRLGGRTDVLPNFVLGNAGVDLFFVISGFVMVYASEPLFARANGPLIFITHRVIRIVPLYWLVTTFYLVIAATVPSFSRSYPPDVVAASYLFIPLARPDGVMQPIVGQGWTLNYEMLFYAIFALAVFAPRRMAAAIAALLLVAIVIAGRLLAPLPAALAFWSDPIMLEFVLGMLLGLAYREGMKLPAPIALVLIVGGVALLAASANVASLELRTVTWGIPAALIVGGSTLGRFSANGAGWRALAIIGDASYALYLFHPTPIRAILLSARWAGVDMAHVAWLYVAVSVIASIAVALAVHYLFERPVTAALRRRAAFARSTGAQRTVDPAAHPAK